MISHKKIKNKRAHLFNLGSTVETIQPEGSRREVGSVGTAPVLNNQVAIDEKYGNKLGLNESSTNTTGATGSNFLATASQISGYAGMFDSIAQSARGAIDASRYGTKDQPNEIVTGVLGDNKGSNLASMWSTGAALQRGLKYVNDQGNKSYIAGSTEELLGNYNNSGALAHSNIDTAGKEWEDAIFDPFSYGVTRLFGLRKTADERQNEINNAIDAANKRRYASLSIANTNLNKRRYNSIMANYRAFGGPMFGDPFGGGAVGYDVAKDSAAAKQMQVQSKNSTSFNPVLNSAGYAFADGGDIHIKPSHRGLFTAKADRAGKGVQEYASYVLANKEDFPTSTVKQAAFAKAASGWRHDNGGMLLSNNFSNGVTLINNGSTHENNPHEGVPVGIAPDGKPNLVEEGEVIFKDYVFSNRLKVPKEVKEKYKLRGPKKMTFAEAFEWAQKESRERENDPISENGLEHIAMILARTQEAVRGYQRAKEGYKAALGGHLHDFGSDLLRTSPIFANLGAVVSDTAGQTNNPVTLNDIPAFNGITYTPLGNYIPVTHFDTRYAANRRAQQAAATRNAIMQSTSPNKWGNLIAADFNSQIAEGEALRQAAMDEYNRTISGETFNRGTDSLNSEMGLKVGMFNPEMRLKYAQAKLAEDRANIDETNASMGARGQNIGALADAASEYAREQQAYSWRDMLLRAGVYGTLSSKPDHWSDKDWKLYQEGLKERRAANEALKIMNASESATAAYGGKIKRRKKGLTY